MDIEKRERCKKCGKVLSGHLCFSGKAGQRTKKINEYETEFWTWPFSVRFRTQESLVKPDMYSSHRFHIPNGYPN
jgi:hypothetical protein